MRGRVLALAVVVTIAGGAIAPTVGAQSGADLVAECLSRGGSAQLCHGLRGLTRTGGGACRDATLNRPECARIDGVTVSRALVSEHEGSWLARALALQRGLDDTRPLHDELWVHTHNSFNADAYPPTFYGLDRNHIYTVTDQLRMGTRAIELDVWYEPSTTTLGDRDLIVCHGEDVDLGDDHFAFGCGVNDPLLSTYLREVRDWLFANPDEVIVLYIENNLLGNRDAHEKAGGLISDILGSLVYKPTSHCGAFPMDVSRRQIRTSGKRIVITGNCDVTGTTWGSLVHVRGDRWNERGIKYGDDFPAYPCTTERATNKYENNWIRRYGDETGLSAGAGQGGDVTPTDARNMVRCGVNMAGVDNLVPFDPRFVAFVWSWATNEPKREGKGWCATHGSDGRFRSADCRVIEKVIRVKGKKKIIREFRSQPFACFDGARWSVTSKSEAWTQGEATCRAEGKGHFSVPWSGYENERLKQVQGSVKNVWVDYRSTPSGWTADI